MLYKQVFEISKCDRWPAIGHGGGGGGAVGGKKGGCGTGAVLCSALSTMGSQSVCRAGCWKGYTGFRFSFDSLHFFLPLSLAPALHSRFGRQTKQLTSSFCAYTFLLPSTSSLLTLRRPLLGLLLCLLQHRA